MSDLHHLATVEQQLRHAAEMVSAGADLIDVGGESGRTDRAAITQEEEAGRVLPVIEGLRELGIAVSVDTWRVAVAEAAIVAGATVVNDVSGLADPDMARLAARTGTGLVIMHTRAAPKRESFPGYEDVVQDVITFLGEKASAARELGVASDQIILDPGPDFAKTPEESVEIIRRFDELSTLRRPLLLAASRKYFVGMITGRLPHQRLGGTLAAVARGVDAGAHLVRVHDVAEVVAYLDVRTALASCEAPDFKGARADDTLKWLPEPTGGHP